ncbi:HAMP domain-containing sensor histidine kinase [Brevibacillus sp. MER 51]|uniref:sensor histidine kinase n=1 Tax=Brevibacillus sp. MER 51 TaxID=2939560 RepID=UPI002040E6C6|nr:HAMP domain-containing sensor histidine kinase [Brevibacillus sp. MER 51]MCM3144974.1 HAMP domain-containing histidine kinase [Brevibacillus sp. MER 51]
MSIKTRLLLSYIAMIIIPLVLFGLVASGLANYFWEEREAGKPFIRDTLNKRDELFAGVSFMAKYAPNELTNQKMLTETDEQLQAVGGALILTKGDHVLFVSPSIDSADVPDYLQDQPDQGRMHSWKQFKQDGYTFDTYEFTFADQSKGKLYFLANSFPFMQTGIYFFIALILSLLTIVALTNGVLTFLVSRSIIRPLYALKQAANEIKEGNLERPVQLHRKDELGELGEAFEEMRGRLHASIHLQLQYEENRKQLISSISHDLKTPITGIKACVEAVQEGIADTEAKREKYMKMIAIKSEQMDRLIDELFLFSRLDLNKLPFHFEEVDVRAYMAQFADELRLDPRMNDVSIRYDEENTSPIPVMADQEKLHRVLMNMVDNSLKYLNKDEKLIRLEVEKADGEVIVAISDNGTGIEKEAIPHIFDRFYRADPSRNSAMGGTGLGLAIVKQIVEGHGGRVWAESESGRGTRICFTLPDLKRVGGDTK